MKVFLSHSSKDKELVKAVHSKLSNAWLDSVDIENGENIPEKINDALKEASHFVLFWSKNSKSSNWVKAELNAAFINVMSDNCKFLIFSLDETQLPPLLLPYKYDSINHEDIVNASEQISNIINSAVSKTLKTNQFINRTKEIGDIEQYAREHIKIIVLHGILGIGKTSLAKRALKWIYSTNSYIVVDFNEIPGIAELALMLSKLTKKSLINDNKDLKKQEENIRYFFEHIGNDKICLILKDVKSWLAESGEPNKNLTFILDIIAKTSIFEQPIIITSSRYITFSTKYTNEFRQIKISSMNDSCISEIIKNNLPQSFEYNEVKNQIFAKNLFGYPLGARLGAFRLASYGYEYFITEAKKMKNLKIGLAKDLISYANISPDCIEYLKTNTLVKSKLRNEEYSEIFSNKWSTDKIAELSDEAFFAGILKIDEDGCYKLEPLVIDYYYDLAFNDSNRKMICAQLEIYLLQYIKDEKKYLRVLPALIHVLVLNNKLDEVRTIREEMTATISKTMWEQYNHRDYEDALKTAEYLIANINIDDYDPYYVKALCLDRDGESEEAIKILNKLIEDDDQNSYKYFNALGRIKKHQEYFETAIVLFKKSIEKNRKYISAYREISECYIFLNDLFEAKQFINKAKDIDDTNIFTILLESKILQKENKTLEALELIGDDDPIIHKDPSLVCFRKGRLYDALGQSQKAIQLYKETLGYNPKMSDATLCLLSHDVSNNIDCYSKIASLKSKLKGKRKYILTNIEARYIGYFKHDPNKALDLLDSVDKKYIDKQWYAVKIQMLEKIIEICKTKDKLFIAEEHTKKLNETKILLKQIYGIEKIQEADLLPDA